MRKIVILMTLSTVLMGTTGWAEQQIKSGEYKSSVVELYTSEGCSSCPPADDFLSRLGHTEEADRIIPLAFHVDYWDYIGWQDPYADAKYTKRQRRIGRINKQASIYTPEFVVDGKEARGSRKITKQVKAAHRMLAEADITLNLLDVALDKLDARVSIDNILYQGNDTPEVYLAVFENDLSSNIDAGENKGRTLEHDFVVRYLSAPQSTQAGQQHQFSLDIDPTWDRDSLGVTVVVKLQDSGRTLQALKSML